MSSNGYPKVAEPSKEQVDALKEKHGSDLHQLEFLDGDVYAVIRPPTQGEWRRFKDAQIRGGESQVKAAEQLARSCTIYPEGAVLEQIATSRPAVLDSIAGEVIELSGAMKASAKKAL